MSPSDAASGMSERWRKVRYDSGFAPIGRRLENGGKSPVSRAASAPCRAGSPAAFPLCSRTQGPAYSRASCTPSGSCLLRWPSWPSRIATIRPSSPRRCSRSTDAGDAGAHPARRPELPPHQPVGALRPPFRRHHRRRAAHRPGAGRAVRVSARATSGSCSAWSSAGRCTTSSSWSSSRAPQRALARRDRARGARPGARDRHRRRHPLHRGHRPRRPRQRRGRRARRERVGGVHGRRSRSPSRSAWASTSTRCAAARSRGIREATVVGVVLLMSALVLRQARRKTVRSAQHLQALARRRSPTASPPTGSSRACCRCGCCSARATTSRATSRSAPSRLLVSASCIVNPRHRDAAGQRVSAKRSPSAATLAPIVKGHALPVRVHHHRVRRDQRLPRARLRAAPRPR